MTKIVDRRLNIPFLILNGGDMILIYMAFIYSLLPLYAGQTISIGIIDQWNATSVNETIDLNADLTSSTIDFQNALPVCSLENGQNAVYWWIPENKTVGSIVDRLPVSGRTNGPKPEISLRVVKLSPYFQLDNSTKEIQLVQAVDREKGVKRIQTVIECRSLLPNDNFKVNISVQVTVQDVNDNAPVFAAANYVLNITEELPVGTPVFRGLRAMDADQEGPNQEVQYAIVQDGPFAQLLDIPNPWEGTVVINRRMDFESIRNFSVKIAAQDNGDPPLMSTIDMFVYISDADDLNPKFENLEYSAIISDDASINTEVEILPSHLLAHDQDTMDEPLLYELSGAAASKFEINPNNGTILIRDHLSPSAVYYLTVKASQLNRPERFTTVPLRILVHDDRTSTVDGTTGGSQLAFDTLYYSARVMEDAPVGSEVLQLKVTGVKSASIVKFMFKSDDNVPFAIDPLNGMIIVTDPLDFESVVLYNLVIEATDGHSVASTNVKVTVVDVNDNPPLFQQKVYSFKPLLNDGNIMGTVTASDKDADDLIYYSLLNHQELFSIDPSDGHLLVANARRVNDSQYELVVEARDNGVPSRASSATVKIDFGIPNHLSDSPQKAVNAIDTGGDADTGDGVPQDGAVLVFGVLGGSLAMLILIVCLLILCVYKLRKKNADKATPPRLSDRVIMASTLSSDRSDGMNLSKSLRQGSYYPERRVYGPGTFPYQSDSPHGSQSPLEDPHSYQDRAMSLDYSNPAMSSHQHLAHHLYPQHHEVTGSVYRSGASSSIGEGGSLATNAVLTSADISEPTPVMQVNNAIDVNVGIEPVHSRPPLTVYF